jgi:hypothetical protein
MDDVDKDSALEATLTGHASNNNFDGKELSGNNQTLATDALDSMISIAKVCLIYI